MVTASEKCSLEIQVQRPHYVSPLRASGISLLSEKNVTAGGNELLSFADPISPDDRTAAHTACNIQPSWHPGSHRPFATYPNYESGRHNSHVAPSTTGAVTPAAAAAPATIGATPPHTPSHKQQQQPQQPPLHWPPPRQ